MDCNLHNAYTFKRNSDLLVKDVAYSFSVNKTLILIGQGWTKIEFSFVA